MCKEEFLRLYVSKLWKYVSSNNFHNLAEDEDYANG